MNINKYIYKIKKKYFNIKKILFFKLKKLHVVDISINHLLLINTFNITFR